jgi:hypothetical protein
MSKAILDADEILQHASPLLHQHAREIQPYGSRSPIRRARRAWNTSTNCSPTR